MKLTPKKLAIAVALMAAGTAFAANDAATSSSTSSSSLEPSASLNASTGSQATTAASADDSVRQAQQALKDAGQDPGAIDGVMGPKTQAALKQYQESKGLTASGSLDAQTSAALTSPSNSQASFGPSSPAAPSASTELQSQSSSPSTK